MANCGSQRMCATDEADLDAPDGGTCSGPVFEQVRPCSHRSSVVSIGMPRLQSELARRAQAAVESEAWLSRKCSAVFWAPGRREEIMSAEYVDAIWDGFAPWVVREVWKTEEGIA